MLQNVAEGHKVHNFEVQNLN